MRVCMNRRVVGLGQGSDGGTGPAPGRRWGRGRSPRGSAPGLGAQNSGTFDPRTSAGIAAIVVADGELATGQRSIVIMAASSGFGVVPEARGPGEGLAGRPTRPVVGDDLEDQVATLALEPLPC